MSHWKNGKKLQDSGSPFDVLYLDFQKAFDSVPHARLVYKLRKYGIGDTLSNWIEDFLGGRKQRVCINKASSSWTKVTSGVPQGSVIGPFLFLLYINDLPGKIKSNCQIFADDTKVYQPILSLVDAQELQDDLSNLIEWSNIWLLGFNQQKCKVLHVGKTNPGYDYTMNDNVLETVTEEKDLGILITNNVSFSKHIAVTAARSNGILGMIKRAFSYIDKESFLLLYKGFIRPHLEYCVQAWAPYLEKDKKYFRKGAKKSHKVGSWARTHVIY